MDRNSNDAVAAATLLPLTPTTLDAEEMGAYTQEFDLVFANPGLRNIALSGPTGSGKSTVMNTWMGARPEKKWLVVSLANFASEQAGPNPAAIEDALINQIVGQMDPRRSPKSRFAKPLARPWTTDFALALAVAAFVALTVFLIWAFSLIPSSRPAPFLLGLAGVAWLGCIAAAVFRIARSGIVGRMLGKMHVDTGQIELAVGEDASPIERYMSDLVYIFDTQGYDAVVFDDLDSFGYLPLFQELRQLNDLANARRDASRERLRFFYLVNDGLFDNPHARAKFFDYIISVIPYLDPSNALALLKEGLAGVGIGADESFLYELSLFIDDSRILRDLVNEAHHYKTALFKDGALAEGDTERLLALLAYKALFPRDFELLQVDQGYVNALLRSRALIVDELTASNAREAAALAREIEQGSNLRDVEALKMRIDEMEGERLQYSRKTLSDLLAGLDNADAVFADPPYAQGLPRDYLAQVLASPHFPLIQFLIMRGWIDETHERFMSNFYSDAVSVRDREFLMNVFQGKPANVSYVADNPSAVVGRLDEDTLSWAGAKNFSLLTHLMNHGPAEKLAALFAGLRQDRNLAWLVDYTESEQFDPAIFAQMQGQLDSPIAAILNDESLPLARRRRFAHRILAFAREVLADEKVRGAVLDFAQGDLAFLQVEVAKPLKIGEGLIAIGYHPGDLYTDGVSKKLLEYVFDNGLYEPTAPLVDSLTAALLDSQSAIEKGFLATRLYNLGDTPLREVVEANADTFAQTLIEAAGGKLSDSGEAASWLLNCTSLSDETARAYVEALDEASVVGELKAVRSPERQALLLDSGHVAATSENILDYFRASGMTINEHLAAFLCAHPFPADLDMGKAESYLGDESGFLTSAIQCGSIADEKLAEIASTYRAQFNHFGIEGLSDERMELLIRMGVVRTTADNLDFVRSSNPACACCFAAADTDGYLALVLPENDDAPAPCAFVRDEALAVFALPEVGERAKVALLGGIAGPVSLDASYPDVLNAAIANEHFTVEDLDKVEEVYAAGDRRLKRALAEALVAFQPQIVASGMQLSMDMVADVAWRMRSSRGDMLGFIASQLANRAEAPTRLEVRTVFERSNLKEYVELIDGPSAVIPESAQDDALLEVLASLGMAGKQSGKSDWQGQRRVNSKGYSRK